MISELGLEPRPTRRDRNHGRVRSLLWGLVLASMGRQGAARSSALVGAHGFRGASGTVLYALFRANGVCDATSYGFSSQRVRCRLGGASHRLFIGNDWELMGIHGLGSAKLRLEYVVPQGVMGLVGIRWDRSVANPLVAGSSPARPTSEGIFAVKLQ